MTDKNGMVVTAPSSNEIIQVLNMRCDGEGAATTAALKGLEHMPLLTQFSREWRNVPGCCGSPVQRYHRLLPCPIFPQDKIGHCICLRLANLADEPRAPATCSEEP
jgi:hypothetical protein